MKPYLALAVAASAGIAATAATAGVVVKSSGPSASEFPVGTELADSDMITLKEGDSVTVLTDRGTRVLTGPGKRQVGARGPSKRSAFAVLTRKRSGARVRTGAVRGGSTGAGAVNPSLWNLDVTQSGNICLSDDGLLNLWRPQTTAEETYVFGTQQSNFHVHVTFDAGVSQASIGSDELPLVGGRTYTLSAPDGGPQRTVTFVMLDEEPADPEAMATVLAENGCTAQLDMLAERLMTTD